MIKLEAHAGEHINAYVERLIKHKKELSVQRISYMLDGSYNSDVKGEFNGVTLYVYADSTEESLLQAFNTELSRQRAEYEKSDAYKEKQKKKELESIQLNTEANLLIEKLQTIDFSNVQEVLFWARDYQPYSNHTGVNVPSDDILELFAQKGYEVNANTGDAFNEHDAENFARYIIGQALDGIRYIGAMHPMVTTFTEQWTKKFVS